MIFVLDRRWEGGLVIEASSLEEATSKFLVYYKSLGILEPWRIMDGIQEISPGEVYEFDGDK